MFEIITVVVVLAIFSAFAIAANQAEKTVNAKAQAKQEAAKSKVVEKAPKKSK